MSSFKTPALAVRVPVAFALTFAMVLVGCSTSTPEPTPAPVNEPSTAAALELDEGDNLGTVQATVGQQLILTLPENLSTGYTWAPLDPIDSAVLEQTGDEQVAAEEEVPGAPGKHVWTFTAAGPGMTRIVLASVPPGEEVSAKYESYATTVEVKAAA